MITTALVASLFSTLLFVLLEMAATAWMGKRLRNNSVVDVVWAFGFTPVILIFTLAPAFLHKPANLSLQTLTLGATGLLWSLRLGTHLLYRVRSHHPVEDVRYAKLREEWGPNTNRKMFWFFQLQGLLQILLSTPFLITSLAPHPSPWHWSHSLGLGLWIVAWLGEATADRQLAHFRSSPSNKGQVCQHGLWRYSRHPNYFFEWLMWAAYACFALIAPSGWMALISPILMFHFLRNVTGIPMTEALSLQSKGEAYRRYQNTTNAFWPWFPKSQKT